MTWKEYRVSRGGRKGWELSLPRFEDGKHPEEAKRMNRFYDTAAAGMEQAAGAAMATEARRVRYRCETDVAVIPESAGPGLCAKTEDLPSDRGRKKCFRFCLPFRRKDARPGLTEQPGDIRVSLRLTLSVSGEWPREKILVHVWRDGALMSSRVIP
jgi:hypothetical protein